MTKDEALQMCLEYIETAAHERKYVRHAIKQALAAQPAPVQEPVAWMRPSEQGYDSAYRDHSTVMACIGNPWTGWIPLYTTPPKRPWVGLTDDERAECWSSSAKQSAINIEAKLKENNK